MNDNLQKRRKIEENLKSGYVLLDRTITSWEWYQDTEVFLLFIHLLLTCNWEPKTLQGVFIDRGQILTSNLNLSKEVNLPLQKVQTALNKLISTNEITIETTNKYIIITLCNFKNYQTNEGVEY